MKKEGQGDAAFLPSAGKAPPFPLFHRHALGEVAGLIDVAAALEGHVEGEQLQRHDELQRHQQVLVFIQADHIIRHALGHNGMTISLITDGVPVIALATQKQVYEKTKSEQIEHAHLDHVGFGRCHSNFRTRIGIEDIIRRAGDGAAHHVHDGQHRHAPALSQLEGSQRIAGLAGLADDDDQILRLQDRLADCEQIKYLASRYVNTQSCFFIGRGFDYALSLEGSLKLKEISYVHSDAYAAGELKHGTISLITDGVPVIALATQKQVYEKTISNAKETRSRGARVLLFTTKDAVVPEGVADAVVRLDEYEDILMPLQLIVPLQLFAYYMAVLRGCDVDKPRNLAKSVTVE